MRRQPRRNFSLLYSGIIRYLFRPDIKCIYSTISSQHRRIAIMATPLKMDFIKAILPDDRCRKKGESRSQRGMRPLPLADPLRMIITSRRLNFALLRPYPHPYPRCPEGSTPQRTASFIPFITSAAPAAYLYCRPYHPPSFPHS